MLQRMPAIAQTQHGEDSAFAQVGQLCVYVVRQRHMRQARSRSGMCWKGRTMRATCEIKAFQRKRYALNQWGMLLRLMNNTTALRDVATDGSILYCQAKRWSKLHSC